MNVALPDDGSQHGRHLSVADPNRAPRDAGRQSSRSTDSLRRPGPSPTRSLSSRSERGPATDAAQDATSLLHNLIREHASSMLAYANGILHDAQLAEDVVQEAMERAWKNAGVLKPERGSVAGWLRRVTHNLAVDKLRNRRIRPLEFNDSPEWGPRTPVVDDHADQVLSSMYIEEMLRCLKPAHRAVVEHVYVYGRTPAQVAAILGIPEGTVKSRLSHGLRALRPVFERHRREAA